MDKLKNYVVVDTETTGFSPKCCRIIEISVSKIRNGVIKETFSTLINPECQLPYFISDITGITDEMVCDKPCFCEISEKLKNFIGNDVIVGHNVCFDIRFLNAEFGEELPNKSVDTIKIAKELYPDLESYRLEALCRRFKITDKQHHRAESDVYMTYKLYEYLTASIP